MTGEREALRDWHRLFGLILTDFFTNSPFVVEIERDLSEQQQFLDVVIVRRGPGEFAERLPDGLEGLRAHNLITFKSHRETLDAWAMLELIGHYVAYRKLVSRAPNALLAEERFGVYAVTARFPEKLSGQVPWQKIQAGVYDCQWGSLTVRVVVAGELAKEPHNAPLHLFSIKPEVVGFGRRAYRRHSDRTSRLIEQLFERFQGEGLVMPFTMHDFDLQYIRERLPRLKPKELADLLRKLPVEARMADVPPEQRLASLTAEQIQEYLDRLSAGKSTPPRKPRRKK
jgi:hypothetical protein